VSESSSPTLPPHLSKLLRHMALTAEGVGIVQCIKHKNKLTVLLLGKLRFVCAEDLSSLFKSLKLFPVFEGIGSA
jgi:hypothetical protein